MSKDQMDSKEFQRNVLNMMKEGNPNLWLKMECTTDGADYFFLEEFLCDEFEWDIYAIENDLYKNCGDKIKEFAAFKRYDHLETNYEVPRESHRKHVLGLILNGAKMGDPYCIGLLRNLYKTYYRKEYNQLKRFSTISAEEIQSLVEDDEYLENDRMGVVLTMCKVFQIETDASCDLLYVQLDRLRERILNEEEEYQFSKSSLPEISFEECEKIVEEWVEKDHKEHSKYKCYAVYMKAQRFIEQYMAFQGHVKDYLYQSLENYRGFELQFARTLYILRNTFPKKEFTYEEVQMYTALYDALAGFSEFSEYIDTLHDIMYGYLQEEIEEWLNDGECKFKPEKVENVAYYKKADSKPRIVSINSEKEESDSPETGEEIAKMRERISQLETQCRHLKNRHVSMHEKEKEYEILLEKYEKEHAELVALREFAYHLETENPEITKLSIDEMKKAISEKSFVIIGGHINWINKLKQEFPDWTYILTNTFASVDAKSLENKDRLFFFTDHISHTAYGKFISLAREKKIPFSYLHGVNLDHVIRQIYESSMES